MELSDVNDIRRELECMSPLSDKTINITLTFRDLNDIVDALNLFYELIFYSMAINIVMWVFDIFSLLTKSFKVPVVLAEKGENNG